MVVINHNYGRFLPDCLDSILNQTYSNIECVLVDNISVDDSHAVIREYEQTFERAGVRFCPVLSDQNLYQTGSSILGFAHSNGSYIIFLDADDHLLPDSAEVHVTTHLMSRLAVAFTAGDMYQTRGQDVVVGTGANLSAYVRSGVGQKRAFARPIINDHISLVKEGEPISLAMKDLHLVHRTNRHWVWSPTSALCFRRSALTLMLKNYHPLMPTMTDSYLMRGLSALAGSIIIDRPVAVYRMHGGNLFATEPALENFRAYDENKLKTEEPTYIREILNCYATIGPRMACSLFDPAVYFDAVRVVSNSSAFVRPVNSKTSSVEMEFLVQNRKMLIDSFGSRTYRREVIKSVRSIRDMFAAASCCLPLSIMGTKNDA